MADGLQGSWLLVQTTLLTEGQVLTQDIPSTPERSQTGDLVMVAINDSVFGQARYFKAG